MSLLDIYPKSWYDEDADKLKTILDACQLILDKVESQYDEAKLGLNVNTAKGVFLDINGEDYDIPRNFGESDSLYKIRIQSEMLRQKNTLSAIVAQLRNFSNTKDASVYEPWRNLFVVGKSSLSGSDKLIDYKYWDYHVVDILTRLSSNETIERAILKVLTAGKTLFITTLVPGKKATRPPVPSQSEYELIIDIDNVSEHKHHILMNFSIEDSIDMMGKSDRKLWWSPAMEGHNPYPWADNISVPYLQLGYQVKNEIQGVDY